MRPCVYVTWQQASRDWASQPIFLTNRQGLEGVATTMITAKSHNQVFSFQKNPKLHPHSNSKCWHDRNFAPLTAVFDIISVDRFASDALTNLEFEACGEKSAPEKRFKEPDLEKEEREREREIARWGTCIKTRLCMWHACSTNFFLSFGTSRYYPWAIDVATVGTEGYRRRFRCLPSASTRNSLTKSSTQQGNAVFMALNRAQCVHHFRRPAIPQFNHLLRSLLWCGRHWGTASLHCACTERNRQSADTGPPLHLLQC